MFAFARRLLTRAVRGLRTVTLWLTGRRTKRRLATREHERRAQLLLMPMEARDHTGNLCGGIALAALGYQFTDPLQGMATAVGDLAMLAPLPVGSTAQPTVGDPPQPWTNWLPPAPLVLGLSGSETGAGPSSSAAISDGGLVGVAGGLMNDFWLPAPDGSTSEANGSGTSGGVVPPANGSSATGSGAGGTGAPGPADASGSGGAAPTDSSGGSGSNLPGGGSGGASGPIGSSSGSGSGAGGVVTALSDPGGTQSGGIGAQNPGTSPPASPPASPPTSSGGTAPPSGSGTGSAGTSGDGSLPPALPSDAGANAGVVPLVLVVASDPTASEIGQSTGLFRIERVGPIGQELTVKFRLSGTAVSDVQAGTSGAPWDYSITSPDGLNLTLTYDQTNNVVNGSVTIPETKRTVQLLVTPNDDSAQTSTTPPPGSTVTLVPGPGTTLPTGSTFTLTTSPTTAPPPGSTFTLTTGPSTTIPPGSTFTLTTDPSTTIPPGTTFTLVSGPGTTTPAGTSYTLAAGPGTTLPAGTTFTITTAPGTTLPAGFTFTLVTGPGTTLPPGSIFTLTTDPTTTLPPGTTFTLVTAPDNTTTNPTDGTPGPGTVTSSPSVSPLDPGSATDNPDDPGTFAPDRNVLGPDPVDPTDPSASSGGTTDPNSGTSGSGTSTDPGATSGSGAPGTTTDPNTTTTVSGVAANPILDPITGTTSSGANIPSGTTGTPSTPGATTSPATAPGTATTSSPTDPNGIASDPTSAPNPGDPGTIDPAAVTSDPNGTASDPTSGTSDPTGTTNDPNSTSAPGDSSGSSGTTGSSVWVKIDLVKDPAGPTYSIDDSLYCATVSIDDPDISSGSSSSAGSSSGSSSSSGGSLGGTSSEEPVVTIRAADPNAWENSLDEVGADPGGGSSAGFVVSRTGDTSNPLTVYYQSMAKSTAEPGIDDDLPATYGSVTIASGRSCAPIVVNPINDGNLDGPETVWVEIVGPPGSIEGQVTEDPTATGASDPNNPGLSNISVTLDPNTPNAQTTLTDQAGDYQFPQVAPGPHTVQFTVPAGETLVSQTPGGSNGQDSQTDPTTGTTQVVVSSGAGVNGVDAVMYRSAEVGGATWLDTTGSGLWSAVAPAVALTVELHKATGELVATTQSVNGRYDFPNVLPGSYYEQFVLPTGDSFTRANVSSGTDGTGSGDSSAVLDGGRTAVFTLNSGDVREDLSAGVLSGLEGRVQEDLDASGILSSTDPGLSGLTVTLRAAGQAPQTTTTDAQGYYRFPVTPTTSYTITVTPPDPGDRSSTTGASNDPMTASAADQNGVISERAGGPVALANLNVGLSRPVSFSGTVWEDTSGSGTRDAAAALLSGVTVGLYRSSDDSLVATQQTDSQGNYAFTGLVPNQYFARVTPPEGYLFDAQTAGTDTAVDGAGQSAEFALGSGQSVTEDAALYRSVTVNDKVWVGAGTGVRQPGDAGQGGVDVTLFQWQSALSEWSPVDSTTTADDGTAQFTGVAPGQYKLMFAAPAGFVYAPEYAGSDPTLASDVDTSGLTASFTVTSGEAPVEQDAGLVAGIGGVVWVDSTGSGSQGPDDPGLAGAAVALQQLNAAQQWVTVATTTSDATGHYQFPDEPDGQYSTSITLPIGYALDPGTSDPFTITNGLVNTTLAAGAYQPATISGVSWQDPTGAGSRDPLNDGPLAGAVVTLYDSLGNQVGNPVTTGPDGSYAFTGLRPENYSLQFTPPTGETYTTPGTDSAPDTTGLVSVALTSGETATENAGFTTGTPTSSPGTDPSATGTPTDPSDPGTTPTDPNSPTDPGAAAPSPNGTTDTSGSPSATTDPNSTTGSPSGTNSASTTNGATDPSASSGTGTDPNSTSDPNSTDTPDASSTPDSLIVTGDDDTSADPSSTGTIGDPTTLETGSAPTATTGSSSGSGTGAGTPTDTSGSSTSGTGTDGPSAPGSTVNANVPSTLFDPAGPASTTTGTTTGTTPPTPPAGTTPPGSPAGLPADEQYQPGAESCAEAIINDSAAKLVYSDTQLTAGQPVDGVAGGTFGVSTLATFTDADTSRSDTDYVATVDWGDGSAPETAKVTGGNGNFQVSATPHYTTAGSRRITVTVTANYWNVPGNAKSGLALQRTVNTYLTATIEPPDVALVGRDKLIGSVNAPAQPVQWVLASFTSPFAADTRYTAEVDLGLGKHFQAARIIPDPSQTGSYQIVVDQVPLPSAGRYAVHVRLRDPSSNLQAGGVVVGETDSFIDVTDFALGGGPQIALAPFPAIEAVPPPNNDITLGTVQSLFPLSPPGPGNGGVGWTVWINWADNTGPTPGSLIPDPPGPAGPPVDPATGQPIYSYSIHGTHVYADPGYRAVSVQLKFAENSPNQIVYTRGTTAEVNDEQVTFGTPTLARPAGVADGPFRLVTITTGDPNDKGADWQAWVTWGDGQAETATVYGSSGQFWVGKSHAYTNPGLYEITVRASEPNQPQKAWVVHTNIFVTDIAEGAPYPGRSIGVVRVVTGDTTNDVRGWVSWNAYGNKLSLAVKPDVTWTPADPNTTVRVGYAEIKVPAHPQVVRNGITFASGFLSDQTYRPQIEIEKGDNFVDATWPVRVTDAPFNSVSTPYPFPNQLSPGVATGPVTLATFTDPGPDAVPGPDATTLLDPATIAATYSATIDWGDNTPKVAGSVQQLAPGLFQVGAQGHSYAAGGTYQVAVYVADESAKSTLLVASYATVVQGAPGQFTAAQRRNERDDATWLAAGPDGSVSPNTGAVSLSHQLDFDISPGTLVGDNPQLVYNSDTVAPRPVIDAQVPVGSIPADHLTAVLTWNGQDQQAETFTAPPTADGVWRIAVRPDAPVALTGVYKWTLTVTAYDVNNVQLAPAWTKTDVAQVVVHDRNPLAPPPPEPHLPDQPNPFGAGWWLSDLWYLVTVDKGVDGVGGMLMVYGTGESRYFQNNGGGEFDSPEEDFGTLSHDGAGYKYEDEFGEVREFDASGREGAVTDRNGRTVYYAYTGNRLTGITTPDCNFVGVTYDNPAPLPGDPNATEVQFAESGGRIVHLGISGGDLALITDPDGSTRAFTWNADLVRTETWSNSTPDSTARAVTYQWSPDGIGSGFVLGTTEGTEYTVTPASVWGLGTAGVNTAAASASWFGIGAVDDPKFNETDYTLDTLGRDTHTKYADGTETNTVRDEHGLVRAFTDARKNTTKYSYDSEGRLENTDYPDGSSAWTIYDPESGLPWISGNNKGWLVWNEYDAQDNLTATFDPYGDETSFTYYEDNPVLEGLVKTVTDARQNTTKYTYDGHGRLETVTDANQKTTTYTYDAAGNVATVTDPLKRTTTTVTDPLNRVTSQTDVYGDQTQWTYDAVGEVVRETDATKVASVSKYDDRGLLVSVTEAAQTNLARTTYYQYDVSGNRTVEWDPRDYDTTSVLATTGEPLWTKVVTQYDNRDRPVAVTEGAGYGANELDPLAGAGRTGPAYGGDLAHTTWTTYDANGNVATVAYRPQYDSAPLNYKIVDSFGYDELNRLSETNRGSEWRLTLTPQGKVWEQRSPGRTTLSLYDTEGNLWWTNDANGIGTRYYYDRLGRLTKTVEGVGEAATRTTEQDYDAVGNLAWQTDGNGVKTTYGYDNLNQRTTVTEAAGTPLARTTFYQYDAVGRIEYVWSPRLYDSQAPLNPGNPGINRIGTKYEYDDEEHTETVTDAFSVPSGPAFSNVTPLTHDPPQTFTQYDALGRVETVTDPLKRTTKDIYDALGRLTIEYGNWSLAPDGTDQGLTKTQWTYDAADNVRQETRTGTGSGDGGTGQQTVTTQYGYDVLNRKTIEQDALGADAGPANGFTVATNGPVTSKWEYDALDRVREAYSPSNTVADQYTVTGYAYDAFGELVKLAEGCTVVAETVNNQTTNLLYPMRLTEYAYDADGRVELVTKDLQTRTYDPTSGRLLATPPTVQTKYGYDALGRKTTVTEAYGDSKNQRTTSFTYDGDDRLLTTVDPLPVLVFKTITLGNRVVSIPWLVNRKTTNTYDALGRLASVTEADGTAWARTSTYGYDAADNLVWEAVPRKYNYTPQPSWFLGLYNIPTAWATVTTHKYDALNRLTDTIVAANAIPQKAANDPNAPVTYPDLGHAPPETRFTYDAAGRLILEESPIATYTTLSRQAVRTKYDVQDRVVEVAEGLTPVGSTNPMNDFFAIRVETRAYDGLGDVVKDVTGQLSNPIIAGFLGIQNHPVVTEAEYDALGRLRTQYELVQPETDTTCEDWRLTSFDYYAGGSLRTTSVRDKYFNAQVANPDGTWLAGRRDTMFEYDRLGRKIAVTQAYVPTDNLSTQTQATLAAANQDNLSGLQKILGSTQYSSPVTKYAYDALDDVTAVYTPNRALGTYLEYVKTASQYDVFGRLVRTDSGVVGQFVGSNFVATGSLYDIALKYYAPSITQYQYDVADRLTAVIVSNVVTNTNGTTSPGTTQVRTEYAYDPLDRKILTTEAVGTPESRQTTAAYDAAGNVLRVTTGISPTNATITDPSAPLVVLPRQYAQVQSTSYEYDPLGRVTVVRTGAQLDPNSQQAQALGHSLPYTEYTYDALGRVTQTATNIDGGTNDGRVRVDRYSYDVLNHLVKVVQDAGHPATSRTVRTWYDSSDNKIEVIDSNSVQTNYEYDGVNQLLVVKVRSAQGPSDPEFTVTARYVRDIWGEVTQSVTPTGTINYAYDRLGRLSKQTFVDNSAKMPDGTAPTDGTHYTQFGYAPNGNRIAVRDMIRPKITTDIGLPDKPTSMWYSDFRSDLTQSVYDPMGNVVATYDPGNRSTVYKYDYLGRVIEKQDRNYTVDEFASGSNSQGGGPGTKYIRRYTSYSYDALGRVKQEAWYLNNASSTQVNPPAPTDLGSLWYIYDSADHVIVSYQTTTSGPNSNQVVPNTRTERFYDALGRESTEYEPAGVSLTFSYDAVGQVIKITDSSGGEQDSQYDTAGRLTWRSVFMRNNSANGIGFSFSYAPAATNADGSARGLLDRVAETDGFANGKNNAKTTYGLGGATIQLTTPTFKTTTQYNPAGQIAERDSYFSAYQGVRGGDNPPVINQLPNNLVEQTKTQYNAAGLVKQDYRNNPRFPNLSGQDYWESNFERTVAYTYDDQGQVKSITTSGSGLKTPKVVEPQSDANGNQPVPDPSGKGNAQTAGALAMAALGNRVTVWAHSPAQDFGGGNLFAGYQGASIPANMMQWGGRPYYYGVTYDGEGNVVRLQTTGQFTVTGTGKEGNGLTGNWTDSISQQANYAYDNRNRLVSVTRVSNYQDQPVGGAVRYTAQQTDTAQYAYDAENRLVSITDGFKGFEQNTAPAFTHTYGGPPLLNGETVTSTFVYVGNQIYGEINSGDPDAGGALTRRYVYGPGTDQILGRLDTKGGVAYYYATDRQGSVLSVYKDTRGQVSLQLWGDRRVRVVEALSYSGGVVDKSWGTFSDHFQYAGTLYDQRVQLQYNRARWYSPVMGRFMSEDPIGFSGGDTNLYRYVHNSYPNATDPSGKGVTVVLGLIGAGIGAIAGGVMEWYSNPNATTEDILYAAGRGAVVGGLAGLTCGLSLAATAAVGGGTVAMGATGIAGAAAGDVVGQFGGWTMDQFSGRGPTVGKFWEQSYRWQQTVGAAAGGIFGTGIGMVAGSIWKPLAQTGAAQLGRYGVAAGAGFGGGFGGDIVTQLAEGKSWSQLDWGQAALSGVFGLAGGVGGRWGGGRVAENYHSKNWIGSFTRFIAPDAPLLMKVCFAPGTPLRTPEGSRNIEDIRPGELVLARDEYDPEGPVFAKVVEEVFVLEGLLTKLRVNGRDILTTMEHPFFVAGRGWVKCQELKIGDRLLTESGAWVPVEAVEDTGTWSTVHNIRVADCHTYFIGCDEWGFAVWAHNWYDQLAQTGAALFNERQAANRATGNVGWLNSRRSLSPMLTAARRPDANGNAPTLALMADRLLDLISQRPGRLTLVERARLIEAALTGYGANTVLDVQRTVFERVVAPAVRAQYLREVRDGTRNPPAGSSPTPGEFNEVFSDTLYPFYPFGGTDSSQQHLLFGTAHQDEFGNWHSSGFHHQARAGAPANPPMITGDLLPGYFTAPDGFAVTGKSGVVVYNPAGTPVVKGARTSLWPANYPQWMVMGDIYYAYLTRSLTNLAWFNLPAVTSKTGVFIGGPGGQTISYNWEGDAFFATAPNPRRLVKGFEWENFPDGKVAPDGYIRSAYPVV
jgi:RHS repeat-associated protein